MRRRQPSPPVVIAAWMAAIAFGCEGAPSVPPPSWEVAPAILPQPTVVPCAPGWPSEALADGSIVCSPWLGPRPTCATDELLVPGAGCEAISPCDVEALGSGQVRVEVDASPGGDGSMASPFATVAEALGSGARDLSLGPGEHPVFGRFDDVRISGSCPASTTLRLGASLEVNDVVLRRLRVAGDGVGKLVGSGLTTLTLEEVILDGLDRAAEIRGTLLARRVVVRDVGAGILGFDAERIELDHVAFERVAGDAMYSGRTDGRPGATITLRDVAFIGGGGAPLSAALKLDAGAVILERVAIEDSASSGALVRAESAFVRDVSARRIAEAGFGLLSAATDVAGLVVLDAGSGVVFADGTHHLRDIVVERVGDVAFTIENASVDGARIRVASSRSVGLAFGASRGTIADLVVADIEASPSILGSGGGVVVERASELMLSGALIERTQSYGLLAGGSVITGGDITIRDVVGQPEVGNGYGVLAIERALLDLTRVDIAQTDTVGLLVDDSTATLRDLRVTGVRPIDGVNGLGVMVVGRADDAGLTLERAEIADAVRWGFLVTGRASLEANRVAARRTDPSPCAATTCRDTAGGAAFVAYGGARMVLTEFTAEEAAFAGVIAAANVRVMLSDGTIVRNAVALVISPTLAVNLDTSPGIDLMDVTLLDNRIEQQVTEVTVVSPELGPIGP